MNSRDKEILALALGNLEATIRTLPNKAVRWSPRLTANEVAALRRRLTKCSPDLLNAKDVRLINALPASCLPPAPSTPDSQ